MELPKGWIVLNILCYESEEDKKVSELLDTEASKEFRKIAIQVSTIGTIDLEYGGFKPETGNSWITMQSNSAEIKETKEEIFKLIKEDYERTN